jgi:DNA-binding transcriptional regulator LsrR (DeoR family)
MRQKVNLNIDEVDRLYHKELMTLDEIAKKLKVSTFVVHKHLKMNNKCRRTISESMLMSWRKRSGKK